MPRSIGFHRHLLSGETFLESLELAAKTSRQGESVLTMTGPMLPRLV